MTGTEDKWQPISIEAEQAVLGAILMNNDAYSMVSDLLQPQHFFDAFHGHLYEVMSSLITAGKLCNPITIQSFLPVTVELLPIPVKKYIARLAADGTGTIQLLDYAKLIRELADRRLVGEVALQMAPNEATEAAHAAATAIDMLDAIVSGASQNGAPALEMEEAVDRAIDAAALAYQNDGKVLGVPTTFKALDGKLGGMSRGDLVILAGRPGMGKSAMILTMLRRAAEQRFKGMFVSLEMGDVSLTQRMMSDVIFDTEGDNLPYAALRSGRFHERLFDKVRDAGRWLKTLPIRIEQQPGLTMSQIAARARQRKRRVGLDILAIDHLDLVKPSGRYAGNKVYELGEITAAAKALAKELDIVVVLLAQLSRDVEKREDKRPQLADLRSSGSIEQDADTVIFLYRAAYYLASNMPQDGTEERLKWDADMTAAQFALQAIVAKQRMGPTGPVDLFCDIASNAIRDLMRDAA